MKNTELQIVVLAYEMSGYLKGLMETDVLSEPHRANIKILIERADRLKKRVAQEELDASAE